MTTLKTSSLLFLRPNGILSLEGQLRNENLSLNDIELLSFYCEPASIAQGKEAGFNQAQIEHAQSLGYLVESDGADIPRAGIWETYNLQRAACLMYETIGGDRKANSFNPVMQTASSLEENFSALLKRRTERFFLKETVPLNTFKDLINDVQIALRSYPWLTMHILVQAVEELEPGIYSVDSDSCELVQTKKSHKRKELLEAVHGQWWVNGGGFCCFFVAELDKLATKDAEGIFPNSYFEMILLLGEAGQVLLNAATARGLGAWMTPAVSESIASNILGLKDSEEALYFFKIGIPDHGAKDSGEKRSPLEH